MTQVSRQELFSTVPAKKAVLTLALPTVISQMINVIYNLADIFFVGRIGDPNMVAAVSIVMPAFLITTALGNLFGIGGSSAVSRALGQDNPALARKHTTFCFYGCIAAAGLYSLFLLLFSGPFLRLYGASDSTLHYAEEYTFWVLTIGAVPTIANVVLAHLLRADGQPKVASIGLSMGGFLNIALDPIFIFLFKFQVAGAALATMLSNVAVLLFFLLYWARHKEELLITLRPKSLTLSREITAPVMASGVPAAVQTFAVSLFFMFINRQARNYSDLHVAGIGIVQKLDMIPQNVTLGLSQGIIPLLGYSYAAGKYDRMEAVSRFALSIAIGFSLLYVAVCEIFAESLVTWFLPDSPAAIALATRFTRIMCVCTPFMAVCNVTNATFQAAGKARQALSVCLFRKLYVGLPMLYLLDWLFPETGLLLVMTVVDGLASLYVLFLYRRFRVSCRASKANSTGKPRGSPLR